MKKIALTLLLLHGLSVFTQNRLIGIWTFINNKSVYTIYVDDKGYSMYVLGGKVKVSKSKYGFSNYYFEDVVNVDSLTISEKEMFYDYDNEDNRISLYCYIDTLEYRNGDSILVIDSNNGMRGGTVEYKKVNIISKIIEDYLKDKEPAVYTDYLKVAWNRGEIKVKKSIIHTDKKVTTKAYLVKDDVIEILERQEKWLRVRYTSNKNKITTGWIKKSDVK